MAAKELSLTITAEERRRRGNFYVLRSVMRQIKSVWFGLAPGDVTISITRKTEKEKEE